MPYDPERKRRLTAGDVVDGFTLQEALHQGGMARLWRVTHPDHRLPLLMKVPRLKGGEEPTTIVGFEVERLIMPLLTGPHVPRFIARGDFTRWPYIVMEHIPGPTLRPRLDDAPLPLDEVVRLGVRVAEALQSLHEQQVVHLDIKPSNILFRPDGRAVLVDYGLSRHAALPDLLDEAFRLPMGTGPYMSPEQVRHKRDDPRSDLFALGVMLYHLATGARPFGQPTTARGLQRRLVVAPAPPRSLRPSLPGWFQEVILRCLEVDPTRRHPSAAALAADLAAPDGIELTERASRSAPPSRGRLLGWLVPKADRPMPSVAPMRPHGPGRHARAPVVMAAVDVEHASPALLERLRETVRRVVHAEPGARLACVSVMRIAILGTGDLVDTDGHVLHVKQLAALKAWARPLSDALHLGDAELTCHVLEATDTAQAILAFAQRTRADQIVMGARGNSALRRYLGSVSSQVVAQAECTVTVVRSPERPGAAGEVPP